MLNEPFDELDEQLFNAMETMGLSLLDATAFLMLQHLAERLASDDDEDTN